MQGCSKYRLVAAVHLCKLLLLCSVHHFDVISCIAVLLAHCGEPLIPSFLQFGKQVLMVTLELYGLLQLRASQALELPGALLLLDAGKVSVHLCRCLVLSSHLKLPAYRHVQR